MERSRNGTLMSLNSQDFENLESVEELYFGERETEDNQERAFTFSIKILWRVTNIIIIIIIITDSLHCITSK